MKLLKRFTETRGKVSISMNVEFDREHVYCDNDKYVKTKIKSYGDKVNTNIQGKENTKRKCNIYVFVIGNATFCYQSK